MNDIDRGLQDLTLAHRALARYTVYLTKANFQKGRTIIETGLTFDKAIAMRDKLMAKMGERRFGDPMYGAELEVDRSEVARPFWHTVGLGTNNPFNPIRSLDEWEAVSGVPEGRACQVLWRAVGESMMHFGNHFTRAGAASFARSLMAELGPRLYDIGITPVQELRHTDLPVREVCLLP